MFSLKNVTYFLGQNNKYYRFYKDNYRSHESTYCFYKNRYCFDYMC